MLVILLMIFVAFCLHVPDDSARSEFCRAEYVQCQRRASN